jgi:hypothetical protein
VNPNSFKATYQGDEVWFILDDSYREGLPINSIVYTLEEAEVLADKPEWTRRIVHEAKKCGAQLVLLLKYPKAKQWDCGATIT